MLLRLDGGFLIAFLVPITVGQANTPESASAQTLEWSTDYGDHRLLELGLGVAVAGTTIAMSLLWDVDEPRWQLNASRVTGCPRERCRRRARLVSDLLLYSGAAYTGFVEPAYAAWGRDASAVAGHMTAINALAFSVTGFLVDLLKRGTARPRPDAFACDSDEPGPGCTSSSRYQSFPSGHTAITFTAAGLSCAHQANLPIYRSGRAARVAVCTTMVALATTTGLLRWLAGRHHLSDVLIGALLGAAVGALLPLGIHYGFGE